MSAGSDKNPDGEKPTKRRGQLRQAGSLVGKLTKKAMSKHGFAHASVITDWAQIIGEDLSKLARPDRLTFPKGQRRDGTLHIRTTSAMALQLQHLTPLLIDRVNTHFGYAAVARIKLLQTGLPELEKKPRRAAPRKPSTDELKSLDHAISTLDDGELKDRLKRLGTEVLSRNPATKGD